MIKINCLDWPDESYTLEGYGVDVDIDVSFNDEGYWFSKGQFLKEDVHKFNNMLILPFLNEDGFFGCILIDMTNKQYHFLR